MIRLLLTTGLFNFVRLNDTDGAFDWEECIFNVALTSFASKLYARSAGKINAENRYFATSTALLPTNYAL